MIKTMILETALKTINKSFEWAYDSEDNKHAYYVSGIVEFANDLLAELNEPMPEEDMGYDI